MILVRLALYLALSIGFGLALFALPRERQDALPGLRASLIGCGLTALGFSLVSLALLAEEMSGGAAWPIDWDTIGIVLGSTAVGTSWLVRVVALSISVAGFAWRSPAGIRIAVPFGAVALASLAWAGHGMMDEGAIGWLHLGSDVLHLLASGMWIGALLGLVLLVARPAADEAHLLRTHDALRTFAPIGTAVVGTLIVTGLVNAWRLVSPPFVPALVDTLWGRLLLAKLALFAAMLGFAWLNRFRLTPHFDSAIAAGDPRAALRALRVSLALETGCASAILAIVAWIGTLEPPMSMG
jgi:putative copper resistance protein D